MRDDLFAVLQAIRDDADVGAMVLRGAGRAFCAGADLSEFGSAPSPTIARRARFSRDVWQLLLELPVPTVAALQGYVFGSGLEMSLFCDLRLAAEGTEFRMPEVALGLIPAAGGTQMLPRICGLGPSLDILLSGRLFTVEEAHRLGIVSRILPAQSLGAEVERTASRLAALAPAVTASIRRAVHEGSSMSLEQGLRFEAELAGRLRTEG